MAELKIFFKIVNWMFVSIWGLTVIDLINVANVNLYSLIDNWLKILMVSAGFIYFIISIPHKRKMQKLEREKLQKEIDKLENENKKNK